MKYFIFLFLILGLFSCQKPQLNRPTDVIKPTYLGIYDGANSDTCYVTLNGDYTQIKWIYTSGFTITFDSVKVTNDTLFTVNEYVNDPAVPDIYRKALGSGNFPTNKMQFRINVSGGYIDFNGVKK